MKTITKTLAAVGLSILFVASITNAEAQGRGRGNGKGNRNGNAPHENPGRGHDKGFYKGRDNDHARHHDRNYSRDFHRNHDWERRHVTYARHHDHYVYRRPAVRWVSLTHSHIRPRYIFYRDYNVYYDCTRDVFISLSNGSWIVTSHRPSALSRVNLRTAFTIGVDYYADDLTFYVVRKRPVYFSVRAIL